MKGTVFALCIALSVIAFSASAYAEDALKIPDGYNEVIEGLPDEAVEILPEGMTSADAEVQGEALLELTSPQYAFSALKEIVGAQLGSASKLFFAVCGLLVIASAANAVKNSISSASIGIALRYCMTAAIFAAVIGAQYSQLESVRLYFERLNSLMGSMIPVGSAVLAMGGNVSTAASGSATLAVFIGVCENLCSRTIVPVTCVCTAISLCNTLNAEIGLKGFGNAIRRCYTFILGTVMTLLVFILSSQTAISASSDSMGARTARLVSSSAIPVVGGTVGDTLRTVASGVGYIKSVVGISGVAFIAVLLLPTLVSLILTRVVFLLTSGIAEMLGCETEGKLLSELGGVWGTVIAVVAMCAVMFILALVIFVRVAVAAA